MSECIKRSFASSLLHLVPVTYSHIAALAQGTERIEYKVISTTYQLLFSSSPCYLRDLFTVQPSRSPTLVTLLQPSVDSSLKTTNRSFRYAAPHLCNKLPPTLHVPYQFDPLSSPSSSPSSYSDRGPFVDLVTFLAAFSTLVLKLSFS